MLKGLLYWLSDVAALFPDHSLQVVFINVTAHVSNKYWTEVDKLVCKMFNSTELSVARSSIG